MAASKGPFCGLKTVNWYLEIVGQLGVEWGKFWVHAKRSERNIGYQTMVKRGTVWWTQIADTSSFLTGNLIWHMLKPLKLEYIFISISTKLSEFAWSCFWALPHEVSLHNGKPQWSLDLSIRFWKYLFSTAIEINLLWTGTLTKQVLERQTRLWVIPLHQKSEVFAIHASRWRHFWEWSLPGKVAMKKLEHVGWLPIYHQYRLVSEMPVQGVDDYGSERGSFTFCAGTWQRRPLVWQVAWSQNGHSSPAPQGLSVSQRSHKVSRTKR